MNTNSTTDHQSLPRNTSKELRFGVREKLILAMLIAVTVPVVLMHAAWRASTSEALVRQATSQCETLRDVKASQLSSFFQDVQSRVRTLSANPTIVDATRELTRTLPLARVENDITHEQIQKLRSAVRSFYAQDFKEAYKQRNSGRSPTMDGILSDMDDDMIYMQHLYVQQNPHPLSANELFEQAKDKSNYSRVHAQYHSTIRDLLDGSGYSNVLLSDATGRIVYSARKTCDFASSLTSSSRAKTNLGKAYRAATQATSPSDVLISDFSKHLACHDDVAGFAISPIVDGHRRIGFVILQIPIEPINRIATRRYTTSETGETYLVGPDKRFRTDSRFLDTLQVATTIVNDNFIVDSSAAESALAGSTGSDCVVSYQGIPVLSSWKPIVIPTIDNAQLASVQWALLSEISLSEVQSPLGGFRAVRNAAIPTALSIAVALGVALLLARGWTQQAECLTQTLDRFSQGDSGARSDIVCHDELGAVAKSLNDALEIAAEDARARQAVAESLERMPPAPTSSSTPSNSSYAEDQFEQFIKDVQEVSLEVSGFAQRIRSATDSLSAESSAQASQIVDTSLAIDEMVESIGQVAESTAQSSTVAEEAKQTASKGSQAVHNTIKGMARIRNQVQSTSKRIKRLGESSQEIGEIVQLISDVADRTSILALNASVQAAMAGDAGHGFGVVAEEVERLSKRCNEATKHIARLVKSIQSETSEAIVGMEESTVEVVEGSKLASQAGDSLNDIDAVFHRLAELIDSMSFAAKQQARGGLLVSRSIKEISSVMNDTASGTKQAVQIVNQLTARVEHLRTSIGRFTSPQVHPNAPLQHSLVDEAPSVMPIVGTTPLNAAASPFTDVETAT